MWCESGFIQYLFTSTEFEDVRQNLTDPSIMYEDNQGCICLFESGRSSAHTKDIDVQGTVLSFK